VAAYPVHGPLDVVGESLAGALDEDLSSAISRALRIPRAAALARAGDFSWEAAAAQFEASVADCLLATHDCGDGVPGAASSRLTAGAWDARPDPLG
jgi:hypothetical protein